MIYTVTFNPALDYVMQVSSFLPGETNRAEGEELQVGGKGINVSIVLARLGMENTALGFLAGDTGELLRTRLERLGVTTDFVFLPAGYTRINVKLKGQVETELNGRGPDIPQSAVEELWEKLDRLKEGDTLILSGSIPSPLSPHTYADILKRLGSKGIRFVVDAAGDLLAHSLPCHPFLVKPNHRELGELTGRELSPDDLPALTEAAQELRRQGAQNVMVSLGKHGAILAAQDGNVYVQKTPVGQLTNSVGAGDSMVAGFLTAWDKGYEEALRLAVAAGSATAFSLGLAAKEEIEAAYGQIS